MLLNNTRGLVLAERRPGTAGGMALTVKFRAPCIFHRDGALRVHARARLVPGHCVGLPHRQGGSLERNANERDFHISYSKEGDTSF